MSPWVGWEITSRGVEHLVQAHAARPGQSVVRAHQLLERGPAAVGEGGAHARRELRRDQLRQLRAARVRAVR